MRNSSPLKNLPKFSTMKQFNLPFPSFHFIRASQRSSNSDSSTAPSAHSASPPASPTTRQPATPHNLLFHPHPPPTNAFTAAAHAEKSCNDNSHNPPCGVSVLPCAVLHGRSSGMVLRRRPSVVDMALSEERTRCDENAIERQGLDLMEPRPVDLDMTVHRSWNVRPASVAASGSRASVGTENGSVVQQPRFVMGGIFEVMEGQA